MVLHIIAMILIAIGALFLCSFSISRIFDSTLPDWIAISLLITIPSIIVFGTTALECYLYTRWFI